MDARLVRTVADGIAALLQWGNRAHGLLLSELGGCVLTPAQDPRRHQAIVERPALPQVGSGRHRALFVPARGRAAEGAGSRRRTGAGDLRHQRAGKAREFGLPGFGLCALQQSPAPHPHQAGVLPIRHAVRCLMSVGRWCCLCYRARSRRIPNNPSNAFASMRSRQDVGSKMGRVLAYAQRGCEKSRQFRAQSRTQNVPFLRLTPICSSKLTHSRIIRKESMSCQPKLSFTPSRGRMLQGDMKCKVASWLLNTFLSSRSLISSTNLHLSLLPAIPTQHRTAFRAE